MKLLTLILLFKIFIFLKVGKSNLKGDVPKFCSSARYTTASAGAIRNIVIKPKPEVIIIKNSTITPLDTGLISKEQKVEMISCGIWCLLKLLLQFYIIFVFLSYYKWVEEMYKAIKNHIAIKYSHFLDISKENIDNNFIQEKDGRFIYLSGNVNITESAKDQLFNYAYYKEYIKIERKVEIYNYTLRKWENINNNHDIHFDIRIINDNFMKVDFDHGSFTFPKIINGVFVGAGNLKGIKLTTGQISKFKKKEKVKIPSDNTEMLLYIESILNDDKTNRDIRFRKVLNE